MTIRNSSNKWFYLCALLLIAASCIGAGVLSAKRQQPKKQWPKEPRVTSMPHIFSKIKSLEVVDAWIGNPETEAAGVWIEIRNNSDKDVMMVDIVCGEGGITRNGLTDEQNPIVVIKPHETTKMFMNFGEMTFGAPLVISGVTYADGTEEGDEASLRAMHRVREHDRAQHIRREAPTP